MYASMTERIQVLRLLTGLSRFQILAATALHHRQVPAPRADAEIFFFQYGSKSYAGPTARIVQNATLGSMAAEGL